MTLPLLDIPDDPQTWPAWLEGHLVGTELGELVDELTVTLAPTTDGPTLAEVCGDKLPSVLQCGLSALSATQVRLLLKHPQRLLDLQERILCDGGEYWNAKLDAAISPAEIANQWRQIQPRLSRGTAQLVDEPSLGNRQQLAGERLRSLPFPARWIRIGILAATVLVGLWVLQPSEQWGWNRRGVLTANLAPDAFLEQLADAADEFSNRSHRSVVDLERDLVAFRRGCDALLAAPLNQLAANDRDWLQERCQVWSAKFDDQLDDLRRGSRPWQEIREDAGDTVRKLATALRERLA